MTESGRYRALPVKLGESGVASVATAFGPVAIPEAMVVEVREYSGGELAVVLEPGGEPWSLLDDAVERVELWLYGTKRIEIEGAGDFLKKPRALVSLGVDEAVDIEFDGGSISGSASHAVLRVQVI